ncbi:molybdopterin molybdotransferase MoeA [Nocardioides daeguensis]|uniref:Molybdopterin molybdenumtransferase n=1 Tax=Nocardioides daeguensis TaxID=908359 RepID=A0ABP6V0Y5_9ACTN|nr:gephyrin-like molybdotransferase Glp [Nocardioides daeguensis]MBV6727169.1 molybdopterin molybdotransferase MoeA [Nocardioides daeguensis]MCR1771183.1 molybdopterin molybdotransferase MoeA [Nocardioides daeguensis]
MTDPACAVDEHRARLLEGVTALDPEVVPLAEALGRVLAADVAATLSVPPFDHAAMDGFAVRAADVASVPVALPVSGAVAAGDPVTPLVPGTAVRIMTGAPVPPGADLVVPFEWTTGTDPVEIVQRADAGRHIRFEGEDVRAGEAALAAGVRLGPAQLGLLTSVGATAVAVRPRPRLAVLSTGAELVAGHVPDSNSPTLLAAGRAAGADAAAFGPAPDDLAGFRALLAAAVDTTDLVVTTGGISAGDHDVVKAALRDDPGFWFGPIAMKPGRPQGCGVVDSSDGRRVPVVTLPGTPIAAYASFLLYVVPLLHALAGTPWRPVTAPLAAPVTAGDRTVLLPGVVDEAGAIRPLPGHAGHSQRLLAAADALLVVPPSGRLVPEGTPVEVLALHPRSQEGLDG